MLEDSNKLWTGGWLPDSDVLRWSLAAAIRVEGVREGWGSCHQAAEEAITIHTHVGETEEGEHVECSFDGSTLDDQLENWWAATVAVVPVQSN